MAHLFKIINTFLQRVYAKNHELHHEKQLDLRKKRNFDHACDAEILAFSNTYGT